MLSWQRMVYYFGLALVEATPPALLLALSGGDAWGILIAAALAGALADWIVLRRLPPQRQGPMLALAGLIAALWVVKSQVGGGLGPLGGWGDALAALLDFGAPRSGIAYLCLLLAMYCFWRGTRLTLHDSVSLHRLFRTVTVSLLLIVGLGFFSVSQSEARALLASTELLSFFVVGLVTIALASATEDRDVGLHRLGWRGMLILLGAVAAVLVLGLAIGSLFGREAGAVLRALWQGLVLIIALIFSPLLYLLGRLIERLLALINLNDMLSSLINQQQAAQPSTAVASGVLDIFPPWLRALIQGLLALVPVLLIIALIMLVRRRRMRAPATDEERESLWSWGGLADDLRGLLARRPAHSAGGLRAALARMRGGDPISRIRRSYIRLLLLGEAHSQPRATAQTAGEYAPLVGALLPGTAAPVDTLTAAYERARYSPGSATAADADAAERAWGAIDQADR